MTRSMLHLATLAALASCLAACSKETPTSEPLSGGNPRVGGALIARYGCAACHEINGIAHAGSKVGPPLDKIGKGSYIGGVLANTAPNLEGWIMHPHAYNPHSAMPELGVTAPEARDMAAYLYSQGR
jgi:cytochrome c